MNAKQLALIGIIGLIFLVPVVSADKINEVVQRTHLENVIYYESLAIAETDALLEAGPGQEVMVHYHAALINSYWSRAQIEYYLYVEEKENQSIQTPTATLPVAIPQTAVTNSPTAIPTPSKTTAAKDPWTIIGQAEYTTVTASGNVVIVPPFDVCAVSSEQTSNGGTITKFQPCA